jgi:hypothetical protein
MRVDQLQAPPKMTMEEALRTAGLPTDPEAFNGRRFRFVGHEGDATYKIHGRIKVVTYHRGKLTINVSRRTIGPHRLKHLKFEFGMSEGNALILDSIFGYDPKNHYSGWQAKIDMGKGYSGDIPGELFLVNPRISKI